MTKTALTPQDIGKIAKLANLAISSDEEQLFAEQFSQTIEAINKLNEIDTKGLPVTSSVTKLENITRPDQIDFNRVLTQDQALSGARKIHKGFIVVNQILEKDSE